MAVQKRKERCQVVHSASSTYSKAVQINSDCAPPPPQCGSGLEKVRSTSSTRNKKLATRTLFSLHSDCTLKVPLVVADLEKNTFSMDVVPELA